MIRAMMRLAAQRHPSEFKPAATQSQPRRKKGAYEQVRVMRKTIGLLHAHPSGLPAARQAHLLVRTAKLIDRGQVRLHGCLCRRCGPAEDNGHAR